MPADQSAEVSWTPPRWLIPWITSATVWIYEKTDGLIGQRGGGMDNLLLYTIGRRSGRRATVCLPYWLDPEGRRIVVASFAGGPRHPAWYHNLADSEANPDVGVRDGRRVFRATAEVLAGEERERIWQMLVAERPFYGRYQEKTTRRIPLVRLIEQGGDE
jgi:deazaflavin-dependent oxidoreductase (nitroreductase family)